MPNKTDSWAHAQADTRVDAQNNEISTWGDVSSYLDLTSGGGTGNSTATFGVLANRYLSNHSSDLGLAVEEAINTLPNNQGVVWINPHPDGTHTWDTPISLNAVELGGVDIRTAWNTRIDYTADGDMLTIDNTPSVSGHAPQNANLNLKGGYWTASGTSPGKWIRLKDVGMVEVYPNWVRYFDVGVSLENHDAYTENAHLGGNISNVRGGVDTVPSNITGGSGTRSFHDTYFEKLHVNTDEFGVRLRGQFDYCLLSKPSFFVKADGGAGMVLGTSPASGTVILAPKCESPGNSANAVAMREDPGGDYQYINSPDIFGGRLDGFGIDAVWDGPSDQFIPQWWSRGAEFRMTDWASGDTFRFGRDGSITLPSGTTIGQNVSMEGYQLRRSSSGPLRLGNDDGTYIEMESNETRLQKQPVAVADDGNNYQLQANGDGTASWNQV